MGVFIAVFVAFAAAILITWGVVNVWWFGNLNVWEWRGLTWPFRSEITAGWAAIGVGIFILTAWIVFILWQNRGEWNWE